MSLRTKSGRVLTDADFEALADEAERGYDVEHLLKQREDARDALEDAAWAEAGSDGDLE